MKKIWETTQTKYSETFSTYFNVKMSKDFNPQDILKELELFEEYLWKKYYHKEHKESWTEWLTRKLFN